MKSRLREKLANDVHVLKTIIPNIELIVNSIGDDDDDDISSSDRDLGSHYSSSRSLGKDFDWETLGKEPLEDTTDTATMDESEHEPIQDGKMADQLKRLQFAFGSFISVVAERGPIVMVIDDMQWADQASISLLQAFLTQSAIGKENIPLLVVGVYRSNEVSSNPQHPLSKLLGALGNKADNESPKELPKTAVADQTNPHQGIPMTRIALDNLSVKHVNQMVCDLLSLDEPQTVAPLVEVVHRNTQGNPFWVVQLMTGLQSQGLLDYNFGLMKWIWNLPEIEAKIKITDNIVGLTKDKLESLEDGTLQILQIAACLGSTFDENTLQMVLSKVDRSKLLGGGDDESCEGNELDWGELDTCVDEGFLEEFGSTSYRWKHDQLEAAAFSLIPTDSISEVLFSIGKIVATDTDSATLESMLFICVNLLNEGASSLPEGDSWRIKISELNRRAGKKSMVSSAFESANSYFRTAIELLPKEHYWRDHYEHSLELFSSAAQSEFVLGNTERLDRYCEEVLSQKDRPLLDKLSTYKVMLESVAARANGGDAIELCLDVLQQDKDYVTDGLALLN
ncbi:Transcriptional regulator [Seminavis robusta]|uniref:Transcriptional regulator n=1 Tax=Seminavis robusta TaxID=568900 RepID=A0A9N8HYI4_9STRA|nr:Transcriptional regulator [Seminavis robusta]|eukprot:Sro4207_g353380.1 Transcriptional regulator (566) ;mRNA; r:925-2622